MGQPANPPVEDGLGIIADRLFAAGFGDEDVVGGALLVDGPGIRELKLWDGGGIQRTFEEVATENRLPVLATYRIRPSRLPFAADVLETIELEPVKAGLEALTLERYTA